MRQSHLVLSNAAIMWVTRVLLLVPQLILVPYLIGTIGETGYGVYVLVWSLLMSIEHLQMALQHGVVKYSAGFLAQGRLDAVNEVVSASFVYSILLSVMTCAAILSVAAVYKDPFGQIGSALVAVAVMVLIIVPLTPYVAVIQSRQRYYVGAIAETVSRYISLLAVVVWFGLVAPSVEALIIIMAGTLSLSRLVQVPIAYRLVPGLRNHPRLFRWESFRLIAYFGGMTVLASICLIANSAGVRWMMGIVESTDFVARLAIMLMPGLLLSQVVGAMTITVMPATSAYEATQNKRMLQELLIRSMRYTTALVLAGVLAAALLTRSVLSVWVGSDYTFLSPYALALFVSGAFMESTSSAHHMLKGMGKLRTVVVIYLIGLVMVPITLILTMSRTGHNPYMAVTAGLAVGHVVCGCLQTLFGARAVEAHLSEVVVRVYAQPLMVATAVCLVAFGIVAIGGLSSPLWLACVSILAIVVLFSGYYAFIATSAERREFKVICQMVSDRAAMLLRTDAELK